MQTMTSLDQDIFGIGEMLKLFARAAQNLEFRMQRQSITVLSKHADETSIRVQDH